MVPWILGLRFCASDDVSIGSKLTILCHRFYLDDLPVIFPYEYIYPEQYAYMRDLKRALDARGHCLLEMPSGTGKTVTLLSLIVAYQLFYPEKRKLIYCSRTVPEIEKALEELKRLMIYRRDFRKKELEKQGVTVNDVDIAEEFLALGLSSRKNLCIHPTVSANRRGNLVDSRCRDLTASWVRERAAGDPSIETCNFYEGLESADQSASMPGGVYTLDDLRQFGTENGFCPYFLARRMVGCFTREFS